MKRLFYAGLLFLTHSLVLTGDGAPAPDPDVRKIQGTWRIESARYDGAETRELVGHTMTFTDKRVVIKGGEETMDDDYTLDPTTKPKHLDMSGKRNGTVTIPAVYQFVDDDTLVICNADPARPRPTELDTKKGDGKSVAVLKRVKQKGSAPGTQPSPTADGLILPAIWEKVSKVNRAWLDPQTKHLSYTLVAGSPSRKDGPEVIHRVWVSGNKARWEMEETTEAKRLNYTLVITPERSQYLRGPEMLFNKPVPYRDLRSLRQAITWHTAIHALYETGIPDNCQMSIESEADGARVVVLKADLAGVRSKVGLGLYHLFLGSAEMPIGRVKVYVRLPDCIPFREEFVDRNITVLYDLDFMDLAGCLAPKKIRFVSKLRDGTSWVLQAQFQARNGIWLLKEAQNVHGNEIVKQMSVGGVSTAPIVDEKYALPKPD